MSYTLKVGVEMPEVPSDEDMVVDALFLPDEDEVHVPKPEDPEIGTVSMDIETVLSLAVKDYATDDDEEIWLEFIE